ncbi:MAG: OB-fold domain-containing protein [Thermaerobacter sp.]|nr:OB-fold domain-containing protein [Thermaerobacter sp.]
MEQTKDAVHGPDHYALEGDRVYLVGSRCPECDAAFYPEQAVCARCGHRGSEPLRLGPGGTLYTWTRVHQSTAEFKTPYVLGYMDFSQNVRVLVPLTDGAEPKIGMALELVLAPGPRMGADQTPATLVHARPVRR